MNWFDYIVIAMLLLSVLMGLWRGFINEVLALLVWVVAFWAAWTWGPKVSAHFVSIIDLPSLRLIVGYGLCFSAVLVIGALVRFLFGRLVAGTGLSGTDRLLGMLFGFARGMLLVTLLVFLLNFTAVTRDPWWRESVVLPPFQGMATWLQQWVPAEVRHYLSSPAAIVNYLPGVVPPGVMPKAGPRAAPVVSAAIPAMH